MFGRASGSVWHSFWKDKLIVRLLHCISALGGHEAAASKLYGGHLASPDVFGSLKPNQYHHYHGNPKLTLARRQIEVDRSFYCVSVTCHHLRSKVHS